MASLLKTTILILCVPLVLFLLLVLGVNLYPWNKAKSYISHWSDNNLGYQILIDGDLDISFYRYLSVYVGPTQVSGKPKRHTLFSEVSWDSVQLKLDPLSLIFGKININEFQWLRPNVGLSSHASSKGDNSETKMNQDAESGLNILNRLSLNDGLITKGNLTWDREDKRWDLRDIDITLSDLQANQGELDFKASLADQPLSIKANWDAENDQTFEGQMTWNEAQLTAHSNAPLTMDRLALNGQLDLPPLQALLAPLVGPTSVEVPPLSSSWSLAVNPAQKLDLNFSELKAGETKGSLSITLSKLNFSNQQKPPKVDVDADFSVVDLRWLLSNKLDKSSSSGPSSGTAQEKPTEEGTQKVNETIALLQRLLKDLPMHLDLKLSSNKTMLGFETLGGLKARAKLANKFSQLEADLKEPKLDFSIKHTYASTHTAFSGKLQKFQIGPVVDYALKDVEAGPEKLTEDVLSGSLLASWDLATHGLAVDALVGALSGEVQGFMTDGKLNGTLVELVGFDLAESILAYFSNNPSTPLRCLAADFKIDDGVIDGDKLLVETRDSRLRGEGSLDLSQKTIDYTLTVQPKDPSPASFETPIQIDGTLEDLKIDLKEKVLIEKIISIPIQPITALADVITDDDHVRNRCQAFIAKTEGDLEVATSQSDKELPK